MSFLSLKVAEVGLKINAHTPFLGASPDGLESCNCHWTEILEMKCPYTYEDDLCGWEKDPKFPIQGNNLQIICISAMSNFKLTRLD